MNIQFTSLFQRLRPSVEAHDARLFGSSRGMIGGFFWRAERLGNGEITSVTMVYNFNNYGLTLKSIHLMGFNGVSMVILMSISWEQLQQLRCWGLNSNDSGL